MKWEMIDKGGYEFRAKVKGGWIVKILEPRYHYETGNEEFSPALTFVPDADYSWELPHEIPS